MSGDGPQAMSSGQLTSMLQHGGGEGSAASTDSQVTGFFVMMSVCFTGGKFAVGKDEEGSVRFMSSETNIGQCFALGALGTVKDNDLFGQNKFIMALKHIFSPRTNDDLGLGKAESPELQTPYASSGGGESGSEGGGATGAGGDGASKYGIPAHGSMIMAGAMTMAALGTLTPSPSPGKSAERSEGMAMGG